MAASPKTKIMKARKKVKKMLEPMMETNITLLKAVPTSKLGKAALKKGKKNGRK